MPIQVSDAPDQPGPGAPLTGFRQTLLTWARRVTSEEDIPVFYGSAFLPLVQEAGEFPYTILTPAYRVFKERLNESLLCCVGGCLTIFQRSGSRLTRTEFPLSQIVSAEVRTTLLASWLKVSGMTRSGTPGTVAVGFNTATFPLIEPLLNHIRPSIDQPVDDMAAEHARFDSLAQSHFKFMNFGRGSLRPGERVVHFVMQPEVRTIPRFKLLERLLSRTRIPAHLMILTDYELILIQDEAEGRLSSRTRYGNIWTYLPLTGIASLSLSETPDSLLVCSIHLRGGEVIDRVFQSSLCAEMEPLLNLFTPIQSGDENDV